MSGQVSRGSAGEYQADDQADVAGLCDSLLPTQCSETAETFGIEAGSTFQLVLNAARCEKLVQRSCYCEQKVFERESVSGRMESTD